MNRPGDKNKDDRAFIPDDLFVEAGKAREKRHLSIAFPADLINRW